MSYNIICQNHSPLCYSRDNSENKNYHHQLGTSRNEKLSGSAPTTEGHLAVLQDLFVCGSGRGTGLVLPFVPILHASPERDSCPAVPWGGQTLMLSPVFLTGMITTVCLPVGMKDLAA